MLIDAYVGRQPIFDRNMRLFAYELLYRSSTTNAAGTFDPTVATSSVLVSSLVDIDVSRILGPHLGFVNMSREFLLGDLSYVMPPDKLVIEVLEDVELDGPVLAALRKLSSLGYLIALDDYVCAANQEELLPLVDIVKVDVAAVGIDAIPEIIPRLRSWGVDLLAEKVETHEEFRLLDQMGFHYFQGYFLARPEVMTGSRVESQIATATDLVAKLGEEDVDFDTLADRISLDVGLSYKLLRLLNSSFYGLPTRVSSIHHGLVLLGLEQIARWILLIAMASAGDKPTELLKMGLVRGRMAENLARNNRDVSPTSAFSVGLFSVLDAVLDQPMDQVLSTMPLDDDATLALLAWAGPLGKLLATVERYERGDWAGVDAQGYEPPAVLSANIEALEWADRAAAELAGIAD
jgi:EAL and modified HD-GYP domain-containing signal transduction protein